MELMQMLLFRVLQMTMVPDVWPAAAAAACAPTRHGVPRGQWHHTTGAGGRQKESSEGSCKSMHGVHHIILLQLAHPCTSYAHIRPPMHLQHMYQPEIAVARLCI